MADIFIAKRHIGREIPFALAVTAVFLLYAGFATFHHEMWRDELHSWLISRDSSSLFSIFNNIRYEGHPSVWYLVLWPLTQLTSNPEAMQWINLLITAGAVFLIAKVAPAPRWVRFAVALGYFPVYEYGAISRNYAISLLALIAFCAIFPYRRDWPILTGILLLFTANTSLPACILAIAAIGMLTVEIVTQPDMSPNREATWCGLGIAAGGVILSIIQMKPPHDSSIYVGWHFGFNPGQTVEVLRWMTSAFLPLPNPGPSFWQSRLLDSLMAYKQLSWLAAPMVLSLVTLSLIRRPLALFYYVVGSFGLLAFFYTKLDYGYLRHQGFLFICVGTALWIAGTMPPVRLPKFFDNVASWSGRTLAVLVPLVLLIHLSGALVAVICEYRYTFSAAKATADMISSRGLDKLPTVADRDTTSEAVVGYLEKKSVYYPLGGRDGSYSVWDASRNYHYDIWNEAASLSERDNSPVLVLVDEETLKSWPPPSTVQPFLQPLGCIRSDTVIEESYCVFLFGAARRTLLSE